MSLEELVLRHAAALDVPTYDREQQASGAMMLPIPRGGVLREVVGREAALAVPMVESLEITIPVGQTMSTSSGRSRMRPTTVCCGPSAARSTAGSRLPWPMILRQSPSSSPTI